jgi:hypothetical protein
MYRPKFSVWCLLLVGCVIVLLSGCGPKILSDLSLKFRAGDIQSYRFVSDTARNIRLEEPSLNKVKESQNRAVVEVDFDQEIERVNTDGSAVARITIKDVRVFVKGLKGVEFDFDSTRLGDRNRPMYALIGQNYTITLWPDGKAELLDAAEAMAAVNSNAGKEKKRADALLTAGVVAIRHSIPSLPGSGASVRGIGESWSKVQAGHKLLARPKAFEKTYRVEEITTKDGRQTVVVTMKGLETDKPAEGMAESSVLSPFAGVLDTTEIYNGGMTFDALAGRVVDYNEKLVAEYVVSTTVDGNQKKRPDILTMGLTHLISLESIERVY